MSINENVHVLAGNHETNCNGNYMQNFTRMKPLDEDTYAGINIILYVSMTPNTK